MACTKKCGAICARPLVEYPRAAELDVQTRLTDRPRPPALAATAPRPRPRRLTDPMSYQIAILYAFHEIKYDTSVGGKPRLEGDLIIKQSLNERPK